MNRSFDSQIMAICFTNEYLKMKVKTVQGAKLNNFNFCTFESFKNTKIGTLIEQLKIEK